LGVRVPPALLEDGFRLLYQGLNERREMNREQKRMMQRQGQVGEDGAPARRTSAQDVQRRRRDRATPREFFRQIREEMRQVSWPTRPEVINYTTIVLFVLIFMTSLIFGLGYGFSKFVSFLFTK
jgi:preprotein translocase subunit SecE